jgi:hypothetical protein
MTAYQTPPACYFRRPRRRIKANARASYGSASPLRRYLVVHIETGCSPSPPSQPPSRSPRSSPTEVCSPTPGAAAGTGDGSRTTRPLARLPSSAPGAPSQYTVLHPPSPSGDLTSSHGTATPSRTRLHLRSPATMTAPPALCSSPHRSLPARPSPPTGTRSGRTRTAPWSASLFPRPSLRHADTRSAF